MSFPEEPDHELPEAAEPGTYSSKHVWVWGAVVLALMIGLILVIQLSG